jgi:hypothetical protein
MKQYLVVYMSEPGERGSFGSGTTDVECSEIIRARSDEVARRKIRKEYDLEDIKVYKLTKRLLFKEKKSGTES